MTDIETQDDEVDYRRSRRYRFDADKLHFTDYDDIESCGVYSYRLFAFNLAGYTSTKWSNVTVKAAKPLIVTSPVINLIDSYTARFEWMRPITYCSIKMYILQFRASSPNRDHSFSLDIPQASNLTSQSVLVNRFHAFMVYTVTLTACVGTQMSDECTSSIEKSFRTPGTIPKGLTVPVARLISPKAISVEWLEPVFKNGASLRYQLVRTILPAYHTPANVSNRTETVYVGLGLFYLDLNIRNESLYSYRVIYTNEFGNSVSDSSNVIHIDSSASRDDEEPIISKKNGSLIQVRMNFNLTLACLSPTSARVQWNRLDMAEILNFLSQLIDRFKVADQPRHVQLDMDALILVNLTLNVQSTNVKTYLLSDYNDTILKMDSYKSIDLQPATNYTFWANLLVGLIVPNASNLTLVQLVSEKRMCSTGSVMEAFGDEALSFEQLQSALVNVTYALSDSIINNYELYRIDLSETTLALTPRLLIESRNFVNSNGFFIFSSLNANLVYIFELVACVANQTVPVCIKSDPFVYSRSTKAPENLAHLRLHALNSSAIELDWKTPQYPNAYFLDYLIYRRESCFQDDQEDERDNTTLISENICRSANDSQSDYVCCDGLYYEKKYGYECCAGNYLPRPFNHSTVCCGGKFVAQVDGYQCCGDFFYVYVPAGQRCCVSSAGYVESEVRVTIGAGTQCCSDLPLYTSGSQFCCNDHIRPIRLPVTNDYERLYELQYGPG